MLLNCGVGEDSWVPWTARRSTQSILKEISPEYSLEGLMLKLKLQYLATWCEELTHLKRPWSWERLKVGAEGDSREWDGWMASLTRWTWVWASSGSWWWTGKPGVLQCMGSQSWIWLSNWTELKMCSPKRFFQLFNCLPLYRHEQAKQCSFICRGYNLWYLWYLTFHFSFL